jgi:hypothetical protein
VKITKDFWVVSASVAVFAIWKLSTLHFRFGDENVYFYMSHAVSHGLLPYKNFFLADPPFFVFFMAGFKTLIGSHLILFKTIPIIFDTASAVLIYLILKKIGNKFAALGPALYLFSFTVLSTSDYVTGAEVMIFFILLGVYLDFLCKPFWSGISWSLACLCKLYAAPALIGFAAFKLFKKEFTDLKKIILVGILAGLIVLLPFFIIASHQTFYDLIIHQFRRPAGLDKWNVWELFLSFEWPLLIGGLVGAWLTRHKTFVWQLILSAIFLLLYQDLYYLYLHLLIPYLVILFCESVDFFDYKDKDLTVPWIVIILYACIAMYPIFSYVNIYAPQGIFDNPQEIATALEQTPDNFPIYGVEEVTPLVALMADRPIFENIIDTNTQNFAAGTHNRDEISREAVKNGIYLVARVADYPDQNIMDTGFENYFNSDIFKTSCTTYRKFPRPSPDDPLNDIAIYRCTNNSF